MQSPQQQHQHQCQRCQRQFASGVRMYTAILVVVMQLAKLK
jgi:hypothetical protein